MAVLMQAGLTRRRVLQAPQGASFDCGVREHLACLLRSALFDASSRSRDFLRFIVEEALAGRGERLSQEAIALAVFGRQEGFDATLDPIVRVQAGRLRRSLERYYLLSADSTALRIELPKGRYAPTFVPADVSGDAKRSDAKISLKPVVIAEADWSTILIHPFGIPAAYDDDAGSRMADVLAMEVCRHGHVRVVCERDTASVDTTHRASARFEFRGSLRKTADGWLVSSRVVDRTTGQQVWSNDYHTSEKSGRWSGSLDDIARVIAARIGAEHGVIVRMLSGEYNARTSDASGTINPILRCQHLFISHQASELVPAMEALQHLTRREPENSLAWTYLARLYAFNYCFEVTDTPTPIEAAIGYASRAVLLNPSDTYGRCVLASSLLVKGLQQSAQEELEQVLRLDPESLAYREVVGWLMALAGDWDRGLALMRETMTRNPYSLPRVKQALWADHLQRDEFDWAYIAALEHWDPSGFWRPLMIACALGHLGRLSEARVHVIELLQAKPAFAKRGRTLIGYWIKSVELRERIVAGLHKAGVTLS